MNSVIKNKDDIFLKDIIYKCTTILVLFFLFTNITFSQSNFKFAWLSDIHIGYPTAEEDLIRSVNDINSFDEFDFTIISGDITAVGSLSELTKAKNILDELVKPYYIIPGNHDTKWSESGCTNFLKLWRTEKYKVKETFGVSEDGNKLFIRTMNDTILALPVSDKLEEPLWISNYGFGYDINSAQIVEKDGIIFYPTKNGEVFALDPITGKILWQHIITNGCVNTITPINNKEIITTDFDGKVMMIKAFDNE